MAISLHTAGTWAEDTSGSLTVTLPTHSTGDMLIARVAIKSGDIANCTASTATSGWAKVGQKAGTTNSGNGTGSVLCAAFWKIATSAAETNPVIDFTQTNTQGGSCGQSYSKGAGESWNTPVGDGGLDEGTANTSHSATIDSHVSVTAGDLVDFFTGIRDDCTMTVPTITQTGVTFAAVVESPAAAGSFTGGADGAYDGGYRIANSGTSSAAAVVTGTLSTAEQGTSWMTRLRVFTPDPKTATPDVVALTLTTFAPTVTVSDNKTVTPTTKALTLSTFAPTVTATQNQLVTPTTKALTLATFAPTVTVSDHKTVTPTTASLTTTTFAPVIALTVIPGTRALTLSTFAPTVTASEDEGVTVTPTTASLSLTAFAPTVTASDHKVVSPTTKALSLTGLAPTVTATQNRLVVPGPLGLTITTYPPIVQGDPPEDAGDFIRHVSRAMQLERLAALLHKPTPLTKDEEDEKEVLLWVLGLLGLDDDTPQMKQLLGSLFA